MMTVIYAGLTLLLMMISFEFGLRFRDSKKDQPDVNIKEQASGKEQENTNKPIELKEYERLLRYDGTEQKQE